MPKPGHKRTDSTHSSNESEYTFSSEFAETEDIAPRTEVHLSVTKSKMYMVLLIGNISNNWLIHGFTMYILIFLFVLVVELNRELYM